MSDSLVTHHALAALAVLFVALLLTALRLYKGPSFADRVLALDLFGTVVLSLILAFCIYSRQSVYLDVAMTLAIVAFMGNTVYGRFIEREEGEKPRDR
jgi:multicomponent Na+:H+ antiporter subunit F